MAHELIAIWPSFVIALDKRSYRNQNILLFMVATGATARGFIDYSLDKRATLLNLFKGVVDACDADPYLMRAAKYHGEKAGRNCPVCKKERLVEIRYIFGDQLGQFSGRIKTPAELIELEKEFGEFAVYIVEVCRDCSWNHLCTSYLLGDGRVRKPPRRQRTLEDEDFSGNLSS